MNFISFLSKNRLYCSLLILLFLLSTGFVLGSYFLLDSSTKNNAIDIRNYKNDIVADELADIIKVFLKYTYLGEVFMKEYPVYSDSSWQNFINFSVLTKSIYTEYLNEMRIHYNISNNHRAGYENFMKDVTGIDNFTIYDADKGILRTAETRDFYCPITFLSPNETSNLVNFLGADICNIAQYSLLVQELNEDNENLEKISIFPRFIFSNNKTAIDLGKKTENGIIIMAFILSDVMSQLLSEINNSLDFEEQQAYVSKVYYNLNLGNNRSINNFDEKVNLDDLEMVKTTVDISLDSYKNMLTLSLYEDLKYSVSYIFYIILLGVFIINIIVVAIIYASYNNEKNILKVKKMEVANMMLSYINHEIRNPLNIIKGLTELIIIDLEERKDDARFEQIKSNLYTVKNSCVLLEHIVNDTLDISRLVRNKFIIKYGIVNLNLFIKDFHKILGPKLSEKPHIKFEIQNFIDDEKITIDEMRIKQILINFIINSLKFTDHGSITVILEKNETHFIFKVIDTGRGISDENKPQIFKPYQQLNEMDSLRHGGLGLGLYLCKLITETLKGEINFVSKEGEGSTFWVKVPFYIENQEISHV